MNAPIAPTDPGFVCMRPAFPERRLGEAEADRIARLWLGGIVWRRAQERKRAAVQVTVEAILFPLPPPDADALRAAAAGLPGTVAARVEEPGSLTIEGKPGDLAHPGAGALLSRLAAPPFAGLCAKLRLHVGRTELDLRLERQPRATLTLFGGLGTGFFDLKAIWTSVLGDDDLWGSYGEHPAGEAFWSIALLCGELEARVQPESGSSHRLGCDDIPEAARAAHAIGALQPSQGRPVVSDGSVVRGPAAPWLLALAVALARRGPEVWRELELSPRRILLPAWLLGQLPTRRPFRQLLGRLGACLGPALLVGTLASGASREDVLLPALAILGFCLTTFLVVLSEVRWLLLTRRSLRRGLEDLSTGRPLVGAAGLPPEEPDAAVRHHGAVAGSLGYARLGVIDTGREGARIQLFAHPDGTLATLSAQEATHGHRCFPAIVTWIVRTHLEDGRRLLTSSSGSYSSFPLPQVRSVAFATRRSLSFLAAVHRAELAAMLQGGASVVHVTLDELVARLEAERTAHLEFLERRGYATWSDAVRWRYGLTHPAHRPSPAGRAAARRNEERPRS